MLAALQSFRPRLPLSATTVALLTFALLVRGGMLWFSSGAFTTDPDAYQALAANLLEEGTFGVGTQPTAYRPPLYPLVLVPCVACGPWSRVAIGLVHLAIGIATVWLTQRLGRRWGLGDWSNVAAVLVACDPILLHQSTLVMTETLATLLAVVGLLSLTAAAQTPSPWRAVGAGAALGLAVLCRPTFLLWAGLAILLLPGLAGNPRQCWRFFAAMLASFVVVLTPWAVRNQLHFGRPIVTTTHGGFTLLLGNNPGFYEYLRTGPWGSLWDAQQFYADWDASHTAWGGPVSELVNDYEAYTEARQHIAHEPGTFVVACLVRIGRLWQLTAHQTDPGELLSTRLARYATGLWYFGELFLAAVGLMAVMSQVRIGHRPTCQTWLWGLILLLSFTAVHTIYWTNLRMRAPLMPVVALTAAAVLGQLVAGSSRPKSLANKQLHA